MEYSILFQTPFFESHLGWLCSQFTSSAPTSLARFLVLGHEAQRILLHHSLYQQRLTQPRFTSSLPIMKSVCPSHRRSILALLVVGVALGLVLPDAGAQVLIYRMKFDRISGFNDRAFTGGYMIAPATGGAANFLFTQENRGSRLLVPAPGAGKLFPARTDNRKSKWVAQATSSAGTGDGTEDPPVTSTFTVGGYVATGDADTSASLKTRLYELVVRISKRLRGRAVGASDADDGTRAGFVNVSEWKLDWDRSMTREANRRGFDVAETDAWIRESLAKRGFREPTVDDDDEIVEP